MVEHSILFICKNRMCKLLASAIIFVELKKHFGLLNVIKHRSIKCHVKKILKVQVPQILNSKT